MSKIQYDNIRDRFAGGIDVGNIVDGKIVWDHQTNEYVVVDDDGVGFSLQSVFKDLEGKSVRVTCVTHDAMDGLKKLMT